MARTYIHELDDWPKFAWNSTALAPLLSAVRLHQGLLLGKMQSYGFDSQWTATLKVLTEETLKSSAIEGIVLDPENVRSSLALRLGNVGGLKNHKDRAADGVVQMMLDATQKFANPLTKNRLFEWHAHLFPELRRTGGGFRVGAWRDDRRGPMQVVSGPLGRLTVHYVAPAADQLDREINQFLKWLHKALQLSLVLHALHRELNEFLLK